jgi:hypothetical protein
VARRRTEAAVALLLCAAAAALAQASIPLWCWHWAAHAGVVCGAPRVGGLPAGLVSPAELVRARVGASGARSIKAHECVQLKVVGR